MKKKLLFLPLSLLILFGCDTKDRTPIPGKRESFLKSVTFLRPEVKNPPQKITLQDSSKISKELVKDFEIEVGAGQSMDHRLLAPPVLQDTNLYTIDALGKITAFKSGKASAEKIFEQSIRHANDDNDEFMVGGIFIEKDTLYATNGYGEIFAIDIKDGKVRWKKTDYAPFRSKPIVSQGRLYAQSITNELVALSTVDGKQLWSHNGIPEIAQLLTCATPVVDAETVFVAYTSGEVYAINARSGQVLWSDTVSPVVRIDTVTGIPHITASPVVYDQKVYVISHGGRMVALDLKTGSRLWQKEIGGIHTPVVTKDYIFVLTSQAELICLERQTGQIIWVKQLAEHGEDKKIPYFTGPILAGGFLRITSNEGSILTIDPSKGDLVSKTDLSGLSDVPLVVANDRLYALTNNAVLHVFH